MKKLLFIILILLNSSTHAEEWMYTDTKREAVYLTFHTIDWLQTRTIAHNPDKWHEQNAILGKHPSIDRVDRYFALTGLAHIAVAYYLPSEYRKAFQYITIGIEMGIVAHNLSVGVEVRF